MINKRRLRIITSGMPRLDTQTHPAFPIGISKVINAIKRRPERMRTGIAQIDPRRATEGVRGRGYDFLNNLSHSFDNFSRSLGLPTFDELKCQFKQLFGV